MEIVKKNLVSIICGVVAILAVVALFWPISGLYAGLLTQVDSRIQVSSSLDSLTNTSRSMPQLSPDDANPPPLEVFPTDPIIAAAQDATNKVHDQATRMLDFATKLNAHLPLVPGELPKPSDLIRYTYANQYAGQISNYSRWVDVLDSTAPPSPAEVQAAKDQLRDSINKQRLIYNPDGSVDPQSQTDADAQYEIEAADVQPSMELDRAKHHRIYLLTPPTANPLPVDQTIKVGSYPNPEQICDTQIVIWVLDDITHAIAQANDLYSDPATPGGAPQYDILHSAVKSIEGIDPPVPIIAPTGVDSTAGVSAPAPKVTTVSASGRVCNGLYDALEFKVRLVVDIGKLPQILKAMQMGQFITINNVQVTEIVDPAAAASNPTGGYRFGTKPTARVELDCEDLLMHGWTDQFLPDDRKGGLGKSALGTPTDNGGGGPPGMYGPGGPIGAPPGMPPNPYAPPR